MKYNNFLHWFTGFSDGESNFFIHTTTLKTGQKVIRFIFSIHLHIDDSKVLYYIQEQLGLGTVYINEKTSTCKFLILKNDEISKLINIFTLYNLNTTKYLDFLDWKKAFNIYINRGENSIANIFDQIVYIKNLMNNNNRTNFSLKTYTGIEWVEHIKINKYWLLGLIEGEGSFYLNREALRPTFSLKLTEVQIHVLEAIKVFLIQVFDLNKYILYKIYKNNDKGISLKYSKANKNSKPCYTLTIKDFNLLYHYFLPFIKSMITLFISKKKLDFEKLEIIARARYYGLHLNMDNKRTILRISYTMNNYNLSNTKLLPPSDLFIKLPIDDNNEGDKLKLITDARYSHSDINENIDYKSDIDNLLYKIKLEPRFKYLEDGRVIDLITGKLVRNNNNTFIYEVRKSDGTISICLTINDLVKVLNTNRTSLNRKFNNPVIEDSWMIIFNHYVRRVKLYNYTVN